MADRRVTQTRKDEDGDITALCNPGEYWSPRLKEDAINDIDKRHAIWCLAMVGLVSCETANVFPESVDVALVHSLGPEQVEGGLLSYSARLGPDSTLIIAESAKNALLIVDQRSGEIVELGQAGPGPGEFLNLWQTWQYSGDTIAAYDLARGVISLWSQDRYTGDHFMLPSDAPPQVEWIGRGGEGLIIAALSRPLDPREMTDVVTDTVSIVAIERTQVVDTVGAVAGRGWEAGRGGGGFYIRAVDGSPSPVVFSSSRWVVAGREGESYVVRWRQTAGRQWLVEDTLYFPDQLRLHVGLAVDDDGNAVVPTTEVQTGERQWILYSSNDETRRRLTLPEDAYATDFSRGLIVTRRDDESGETILETWSISEGNGR